MSTVAGAAVTAVLPEIYRVFSDIQNAELLVKFILTSTSLGVVIGSPFTGYIIDKWGRRNLIIFSVLIYGISGTSGFFLNSLYLILVTRFIMGLAVSGIMTGSTALIADYYEGPMRSKMMGYSGAFIAFGAMIALIVGGYLAEIDWRMPFLLFSFSFVLLIFVIKSINEPEFQEINNLKVPILRYPIKIILFAYLFTFTIQMCFYLIPLQLPFLMEESINSSPSEVGFAIGLSQFVAGMLAISFSFLKKTFNYQVFLIFIFASMSIGYYLISISNSYLLYILGLNIASLGLGLSVPVINLWLVEHIPENKRGLIIGGLTTSFFLGRFFSPILAQPIIDNQGFDLIFIYASILLLIFVIMISMYNLVRKG
jgi:MFS family permease